MPEFLLAYLVSPGLIAVSSKDKLVYSNYCYSWNFGITLSMEYSGVEGIHTN